MCRGRDESVQCRLSLSAMHNHYTTTAGVSEPISVCLCACVMPVTNRKFDYICEHTFSQSSHPDIHTDTHIHTHTHTHTHTQQGGHPVPPDGLVQLLTHEPVRLHTHYSTHTHTHAHPHSHIHSPCLYIPPVSHAHTYPFTLTPHTGMHTSAHTHTHTHPGVHISIHTDINKIGRASCRERV